jgi:hypothetical protein
MLTALHSLCLLSERLGHRMIRFSAQWAGVNTKGAMYMQWLAKSSRDGF